MNILLLMAISVPQMVCGVFQETLEWPITKADVEYTEATSVYVIEHTHGTLQSKHIFPIHWMGDPDIGSIPVPDLEHPQYIVIDLNRGMNGYEFYLYDPHFLEECYREWKQKQIKY